VPGFSTPFVVLFFHVQWVQLRCEVIVRVVDIGGIDDHHQVNRVIRLGSFDYHDKCHSWSTYSNNSLMRLDTRMIFIDPWFIINTCNIGIIWLFWTPLSVLYVVISLPFFCRGPCCLFNKKSCLYCLIMCLYVLSSVLWCAFTCPVRSLSPVFLLEGSCLIQFIYVCLCIVLFYLSPFLYLVYLMLTV
jgi:hypothetical protein